MILMTKITRETDCGVGHTLDTFVIQFNTMETTGGAGRRGSLARLGNVIEQKIALEEDGS